MLFRYLVFQIVLLCREKKYLSITPLTIFFQKIKIVLKIILSCFTHSWSAMQYMMIRYPRTWSCRFDMSDFHHNRPARIETDSTWNIRNPEYDSCFRSCKPLLSSTMNCSHQVVVHWHSPSAKRSYITQRNNIRRNEISATVC